MAKKKIEEPKAKIEKKVVKTKAPVAPVAVAAPVVKKVIIKKVEKAESKLVTPEERQKMIEQAAYFRAEKLGWQVDPHANWVAAEAEVDAILAKR
ncbi:MAG TPA: hypothetical protein DCZ95_15950 [Verrucomicrobia bacterium]|nr:MAG: hypothetical protein A2X46_06805 [Lentisphaerae bacterium GWF2_57_35]HBA85576.1 hypothetical protein [Verrucomicrobiota bacterium]